MLMYPYNCVFTAVAINVILQDYTSSAITLELSLPQTSPPFPKNLPFIAELEMDWYFISLWKIVCPVYTSS